jgi:alkylation response protein AidB-like acyl-CoA dehydrogenase
MDFELNKTQKDIQKAVRDFTKGEFDKDLALELEKSTNFPRKIWKKACDLGLLGVHFPEEYSGQGWAPGRHPGHRGTVPRRFHHRQCRGPFRLRLRNHPALRHREQKKQIPAQVAEGEMLSAGAFTEPDHGSDITRMNTTAVKDGDEWVINGQDLHHQRRHGRFLLRPVPDRCGHPPQPTAA